MLLLDQLTRNVFRGTPAAYSGDAKALALALAAIEAGSDLLCGPEQRLFFVMPLVHAEDARLQAQALVLAHEIAEASSDALRPLWETGAERIAHYGQVIARFGRFPGRNAILGRASTLEELGFLESEAKKASPLAKAAATLTPAAT